MQRHPALILTGFLALSALGLAACGSPVPDSADDAAGVGDPASVSPEEIAAAFQEGSDKFIPAAVLAAAVDAGQEVVFVDARPAMDYEFGHIPDAVNVPYFEAEQHLDALPKDKWLVTYCECPHAEAVQTADALLANGFTKVKVIDEGLAGWRELGRPIVGEDAGS